MLRALFPVRSVRFALILYLPLLSLVSLLSFLPSLAFVHIFLICALSFLSRSFLRLIALRDSRRLEYRQSRYSENSEPGMQTRVTHEMGVLNRGARTSNLIVFPY